jgi:hypothetical protein
MQQEMPEVYNELYDNVKALERHYRDMMVRESVRRAGTYAFIYRASCVCLEKGTFFYALCICTKFKCSSFLSVMDVCVERT